jgi:hypothetical protein
MLIISQDAWLDGTRYSNITGDRHETNREILNRVFDQLNEPRLDTYGVYTFPTVVTPTDLFSTLYMERAFVHLVDIGDNYTGAIDVNHPAIIVSSPNTEKLKRTGELGTFSIEYLPIWSWEDIVRLNKKLPVAVPDVKLNAVRKDPKALRRLYDIFGGIPREIFRDRTVNTAIDNVINVIADVKLDVWEQILANSDYTKLPKMVPGVLVHIEKMAATPTTPAPDENFCTVTFASKYIGSIVIHRFYRSQRAQVMALVTSVKGSKKMMAQLRGNLLEERMHEVLTREKRDFKLIPLLPSGGKGKEKKFELPLLKIKQFRYQNMTDLTELAVDDYC